MGIKNDPDMTKKNPPFSAIDCLSDLTDVGRPGTDQTLGITNLKVIETGRTDNPNCAA